MLHRIQDIERHRRLNEIHETQRDSSRGSRTNPDEIVNADEEEFQQSVEGWYRKKKAADAKRFADIVQKPLNAFLHDAYHFWQTKSCDAADWHSAIFWFAWFTRGHPDLKKWLKRPKLAADHIEATLKHWMQGRLRSGQPAVHGDFGNDAWGYWFGVARADARSEFMDVWAKARFMPGASPLQQAFDEARRMRLLLDDKHRELRDVGSKSERREDDYEFFISVAGHLQVTMGAQPIKLPCQKMSELIGVSKMTISRWRRWAIADGYISITKEHKFRSKGLSNATEFRFDTDRYPVLKEKAQT